MRTHPHIPRATVATVVAALALVSCSGGDDADTAASTETSSDATAPVTSPTTEPTTTPSSTSTTTTSTTSTTTTTTAAPTTTAPPTTTEPPGTTGPTSSTVPVEISDPSDPEIQAMFAVAEEHFRLYDLALQQPDDAGREAAVLATTTGGMTDTVSGTLARLRDEGRVQVPNPTEPDRVEIIDELGFILGDIGNVEVCIISPSTLLNVGVELTDEILERALQSWSASYSMAKVEGTWRVSGLQLFTEYEGQMGCD